ncbi:GILT-like protein 1 [Cotesia glomerata]|uniref:Uncharacterized protein n=1 Tax=Cotesia glomerata TaxID=32391 RepID=A0AAV7ISU9_COTGL|nr:GILT-like protein 1 [Cotesia glomerata]KAH0558160.1 hypothetical protein KQX54_014692 [Cotesia glomerata]
MHSSISSVFVAIFALAYFSVTSGCPQKACVGVTVYYESLCGDSLRFIKGSLVPTYAELKDYLDVTFVPYGKASHERDEASGGWNFSCQHGPPECKGNKAQACGLYAIKSIEKTEDQQDLSVRFVGCAMSSDYPSSNAQQCAASVGLKNSTQELLNKCESDVTGDNLLANYGDMTHSLGSEFAFVPTIVINDKFTGENQLMALTQFKKLICNNLPSYVKPPTCGQ